MAGVNVCTWANQANDIRYLPVCSMRSSGCCVSAVIYGGVGGIRSGTPVSWAGASGAAAPLQRDLMRNTCLSKQVNI